MIKSGIIIVYFGKLPEYFHYFLACCESNTQISWILFSDQLKPFDCPKNFFYNFLDINNFNKLASEKLGFPVEISNPYKLCDFKPTYGKLFEDFLNEYDYWGYSDIDIIYGNIHQFVLDEDLQSFEIISFYSDFLSGPFCLYRNTESTKNLFRNCLNHQKTLQNPEYLGFDENIFRKDITGFSLKKLVSFSKYLLIRRSVAKKYFYSLTELRYGFQWHFKRKNIVQHNPADMTEVVFDAVQKKKVKASFTQLIFSDRFFRRIGRGKWTIKWESGMLTDIYNGKVIFAFHFPFSKNIVNFSIEPHNSENKYFIISESGIKNG